jgi:hypothetical protein
LSMRRPSAARVTELLPSRALTIFRSPDSYSTVHTQ